MNNIRCAQCGLMHFATDTMCKRCKQPLAQHEAPPSHSADAPPSYFTQAPQPHYGTAPGHFGYDRGDRCTICDGTQKLKHRYGKLYGHTVCKSCASGFANRRGLAYIIDILLFRIGSAVLLAAVGMPELYVFIFLLTFFLKDSIAGRSPGKVLCGLQVVDAKTGEPAGPVKSFLRNIVLIVPIVPLVEMFKMHRGQRMGDKLADTRVIIKKYEDNPAFSVADAY